MVINTRSTLWYLACGENNTLKTKPRMNLELMQTMGSMIVKIQNIEECLNIGFKQDERNENQFYFRMDWQNKKFLKSLVNNNEFSIFEV